MDALPLIATAAEGISIWQPGRAEPVHATSPHAQEVTCLRWTSDDRVVASGSRDGTVVLTRLGQPADTLQVAPSGSGVAVLSLTWSPGSRYLATGSSDSMVRVFDLQKGVQALTLRGHHAAVRAISWSPSEVYVASSSDAGEILVHRVQGSVALMLRFDHPPSPHSPASEAAAIGHLQWAPFQQTLLAAATDDGAASLWEATPDGGVGTSPLHIFREHVAACTGIQWSPVNQHLLVTSGADGRLLFYDVTKLVMLRSIYLDAAVTAFCLSPDSTHLACGTGIGKLRLYDLRCNEEEPMWAVQAHRPASSSPQYIARIHRMRHHLHQHPPALPF